VEDIVNIGVRIVFEMEELGLSFNSSTFMFGVDVRYEVLCIVYMQRRRAFV
jgi:hypothetical protein